jgi:PAS domain S-box-containing protein
MLTLVIVLLFICFIFINEHNVREKQKHEVNSSANILAEAVWTMFTPASKTYIENIFKERRYKHLSITTNGDVSLLTTSKPNLNKIDSFFVKLNLIQTNDFISKIFYKNDQIGLLRVTAYNFSIYLYFYITFLISLLLLATWFYLKVYESKTLLEQRVSDRTTELENSKQRLSFALDASKTGIWETDLTTGDGFFDSNYYKIAGYEPNEFPHKYEEWLKRIHPDDIDATLDEVTNYLKGSSDIYSSEFRFLRKDSSWMWILSQGQTLEKDSNGNIVKAAGTHTDIDDQKRANEQLHMLNATLSEIVTEEIEKNRKQEEIIHQQKKLADMGNMISAISHQWRQPLTAVGLNIQDIVDAYENNELDLEYLKKFESSSMELIQYLSTTIDDFRYYYRPDKEVEKFQVVEEIFSLTRLISSQLQNKFIELNLACNCTGKSCTFSQSTLECSLKNTLTRGYKGEFKQVLFNIIYNAIDAIEASQNQGIISINIISSDKYIETTISDNAGGISENILTNIFDPYFSTKEEGKGTGIGLYMSKVIIEDHMNGKLTASNNDLGAVFTIQIPHI